MDASESPPPIPAPAADGYIPTRKRALAEALLAETNPGLRRAEDVFRLLTAILHYEAAAQIETLKDLYHPLDPDTHGPAAEQDDPARFEATLIAALARGNFQEVDSDGHETRRAARLLTGLQVRTSSAGIRNIRFFVRGGKPGMIRRPSWFGAKPQFIEAEILRDVVVLVACKSENESAADDRKWFQRMRGALRPASMLIKHFRNVARAELLSLHPGARPAMRRRDQVFFAVPAVAGGVPILLQLGPALPVLFAVLAAYLGLGHAIENDDLKRALAALSGFVAIGAFLMRQWTKFDRQSLKYQKQLADTVYFRTMANNSAVLDTLIGEGEEQDAKEAMLAYWALLHAGKPLTRDEIDQASEHFLRNSLALNVDFEIGDALGKLTRLGLVVQESELYRALAPDDALQRLDAAWDNYFKYAPQT